MKDHRRRIFARFPFAGKSKTIRLNLNFWHQVTPYLALNSSNSTTRTQDPSETTKQDNGEFEVSRNQIRQAVQSKLMS
jgi:hypothetical protein